jgi:hypothetical protein
MSAKALDILIEDFRNLSQVLHQSILKQAIWFHLKFHPSNYYHPYILFNAIEPLEMTRVIKCRAYESVKMLTKYGYT